MMIKNVNLINNMLVNDDAFSESVGVETRLAYVRE